MPFTPPLFGKLGKDCSDLLKKKYDFKNKVTSKYSISDGLPLDLEVNGDFTKDLAGSLKSTWKDSSFGEVETTCHTAGKLDGSVKLKKLFKGLEVTAKGSASPCLAGTVSADLRQENFSASAEFAKSKLTASGVVGTSGLSFGFKGQCCLEKQILTDYNLGLQYAQPDFIFTVLSKKKGDDVEASLYHTGSKAYSIGVQMKYPSSGKTSGTVGTQYKLDKATTLKAKVDSLGVLSTALEHTLANPCLKVGLAAQFSGVGTSTITSEKFGIGLTFGN